MPLAAGLVIGATVAPRLMISHAAGPFAALDLMCDSELHQGFFAGGTQLGREQYAEAPGDPYHLLRLPSGFRGYNSA